MKKLLLLLLCVLLITVSALADGDLAIATMDSLLAADCPGAALLDARWLPSEPGALIGLYTLGDHVGAAIYQQQEDQSFTVASRNDELFALMDDAQCLLDGWPENDPDIWYTAPGESYFLRIARSSQGDWIVRHMAYTRTERDIQYALSEDEESLIVSDVTWPRIWWPIDRDALALSDIDVSKICDLCDEAVDYMHATNPLGYRIDWDE